MASRTYAKGLAECNGCGKLTRPSTARAASFNVPTVKRHGGGLCISCYTEGKRKTERQPEPAIREAYEAFIRSRRNRGIPEEGLKAAS